MARRHWPGAESVLPRLSRSANHGRLWFALAAGMAATRTRSGRRAALRGAASLAVASATVNVLGKRSVRRARPVLDAVPVIRRLHRQPHTTSFPSGHSASAAAFAAGVALESPRWGAALAPVAASVAFSRVYTGVHYPSDVLAGAALGLGAALAVRGLAPTRGQLPPPARPVAEAPALPEGKGLVVVANSVAGATRAGRTPPLSVTSPETAVRRVLPRAEVVVREPENAETEDAEAEDPGGPTEARRSLAAALDEAARRALALGGALGVYGGDGTVNAAAAAAVRYGLPLAVLPGGSRNHFALDLGIGTPEDTARAVRSGAAVAVDLGRFSPGPNGAPHGFFVNTLSLGCYPELVRLRERWAPRIGAGPASVLAAWRVLRTDRPVVAGLAGRPRSLWLLFAGNCTYRGVGLAPVHRHDLADGLLDVRTVRGGRLARTRLLSAAVAGALGRRPRHRSAQLRRLQITGVPEGGLLAYDGEVAPAPRELTLDKEREALTVYRPPEP